MPGQYCKDNHEGKRVRVNEYGGGGVGWVGRNLCTRLSSEKAKLKGQHGNKSQARKRKTKGKRQDDHTEVC